ncbi:hypothetical protein DPMN_098850 [Dreissena polymorpha]|uniref:Uncharacterized protein n=1 Tax=Dreissena polymorpha TaxID=45954 RepID=A0A9D4LCZ7_DREPO|nr:hypothetical protein DPMN_098850 [Dreissena polymorpha]
MDDRCAKDIARLIWVTIGRIFTGEAGVRDAPLAVRLVLTLEEIDKQSALTLWKYQQVKHTADY